MSAALMQAFFASQRKLRTQKATDVPDPETPFLLQLEGSSTIEFRNINAWQYKQIRDKINILSKDPADQTLSDLAQKVKNYMENSTKVNNDDGHGLEVDTPLVQVQKKRKVLAGGCGSSASSSRALQNLGQRSGQLVLKSQFQKMMSAFRNEQEDLINRAVMASKTSVMSEAVQSLVRKPTREVFDEAVELLTANPSEAIQALAVEETVKELTKAPTEEIEKQVVDRLAAQPTRFMVDAAVDLLYYVPTDEIKDRVLKHFQKNCPAWVEEKAIKKWMEDQELDEDDMEEKAIEKWMEDENLDEDDMEEKAIEKWMEDKSLNEGDVENRAIRKWMEENEDDVEEKAIAQLIKNDHDKILEKAIEKYTEDHKTFFEVCFGSEKDSNRKSNDM